MQFLLLGLKAAAEPTRLRLLALCAHSDLTVSELTQILGQSQPRVSRHLKLLCEAGLLDRLREGNWAYFRLASEGSGAELARTLVDSLQVDDPVVSLDLERLETIMHARARRAADYFRRNAAKWDEIRSLYVDDAEVEHRLLELVPEDGVHDLLDIGTGTGRILEVLAPRTGRAVGIDGGAGCVLPTRESIEAGDYVPLSRPLHIYVNVESLTRPEVAAFVEFSLNNAAELAAEVGYIGLSEAEYRANIDAIK